jgi:putative ABC transport system permease protein
MQAVESDTTGATPGQVLGMVGCEGLVLTVSGVLFGTEPGLAGIVPFTHVRTDDILPAGQGLGIWLGIVAGAGYQADGVQVGT